jgi:hypothetical protein
MRCEVLGCLGRHEAACQACDQALVIDRNSQPRHLFNLAVILGFLRQLEGSEQGCDQNLWRHYEETLACPWLSAYELGSE